MGWKWAYYGDIPENAVACDDNSLENCYLGVSMYSDGICRESIGKIDANEGMIHFSMNREPYMCPFFMYLTVKKQAATSFADKDIYHVINV